MKRRCCLDKTGWIGCATACCCALIYMAVYAFYFSNIEVITHTYRHKAIYLYAARPVFFVTLAFLLARVAARRWLRAELRIPRRLCRALGLVTAALYPVFLSIHLFVYSNFIFNAVLFLLLHPWLFLVPGALLGLSVKPRCKTGKTKKAAASGH